MSAGFRFLPNAQRAVIGWLVMHAALLQQEAAAELDQASGQIFVGLEEWLEGRCVAEIPTGDDETPVVDFIGDLAADFRHEAIHSTRRRPSAVKSAFSRLVDHVCAAVDSYRGAPHDPVALLNAWVRQVTVTCYNELPDAAIADGVPLRLDDVETAVFAARGVPPDAADDWRINGCTRFPLKGGPAWRVELTLGLALDSRSWHAAGYVLMHELCNHAVQGPWGASCSEPGPDDVFAEGWMDYVARLLHEIYVWGAGQLPALDQPQARCDAAATYNYERQWNRRPGRRRRGYGAEVASKFNKALLGEEQAPASETFLRLSLHLNASETTSEQREAFVYGVDAAYAAGVPIELWVAQYESTGELEEIVQPVLDVAAQARGDRSVLI